MSVTDKPGPGLTRMLQGFELEVSVGIHEEEGHESHGEDGLTNAELGAIHEFGLGPPQRSFVRGYFDENQQAIEADQDAALGRILDGADPETEAGRLAAKLEGGMKERVLARIPPPLSEATKAKRGDAAVPLVATSQLLGSIRGKVNKRT